MKYQIEQKDFDKLKQLDRIEYRQSRKEVEEYYDTGTPINGVFVTLWLSSLILAGIGFLSQVASYVTASDFMIKMLVVYLVIYVTLTFFLRYKRDKAIEELNKKYFSTSISAKQRK